MRRTVYDVIRAAAEVSKVSRATILHPTHRYDLVEIRVAIALVAREDLKTSYTQIGHALNRNHSTIMHYVKRFDRVPVRGIVSRIRSKLKEPTSVERYVMSQELSV